MISLDAYLETPTLYLQMQITKDRYNKAVQQKKRNETLKHNKPKLKG